MRRHRLRTRYGHAKWSREREAVHQAALKLIMGKRLEVHGKAGFVLYMGSTTEARRDPFWYEHPGGRTYKETAEEVVRTALRHVGLAAIEHAKVYAS